MTLLTIEMFKCAFAMVALTSCLVCLLTTGSDLATAGVRRFAARLVYDQDSVREFAGAMQFLSMPLAAIVALYSWADYLKLETTKNWLTDNSGLVFGFFGILFLQAGIASVVIDYRGSRRSQINFYLAWTALSSAYEGILSFVRAELAAFVIIFPILVGAILPYYSLSLSLDFMAIATFGILCYATVFIAAMAIVKERRLKRRLYWDFGFVMTIMACGAMVLGQNVWTAESILNGSLRLVF